MNVNFTLIFIPEHKLECSFFIIAIVDNFRMNDKSFLIFVFNIFA